MGDMMSMMDGQVMGLTMGGVGILLLVVVAVLILSLVALVKYLRAPR